MQRLRLLLLYIGLSTNTWAQAIDAVPIYNQSAIKYYTSQPSGTTRSLGMGNTFTALGADISSCYTNPAGLGFYNRSEVSLSLSQKKENTEANYIGSLSSSQHNPFNINNLGAVFNRKLNRDKLKSYSFAISFQNLARFNHNYNFHATNNVSSITDAYAYQAFNENVTPQELESEFDINTGTAQTLTSLFYNSFAVDYEKDSDNNYIPTEVSSPVNQFGNVKERGRLNQTNFSIGLNFKDKIYVGGTIGLQVLNHNIVNIFDEEYPNGSVFNAFKDTEEIDQEGVGLNVGIGLIYKLIDNLQIGANITTPTFMRVNEIYYRDLHSNPINPAIITREYQNISLVPNEVDFKIISPLKTNFGLAYFLPKKVGVVSAELELVNYPGMRIRFYDTDGRVFPKEQENTQTHNQYLKNNLVSAVNFKLGGEVRAKDFRFRLGSIFTGSPYASVHGNNDTGGWIPTAGLGYRNEHFFADFAYTFTKTEDSYTPYTAPNNSNIPYFSADIVRRTHLFSFSIGKFF